MMSFAAVESFASLLGLAVAFARGGAYSASAQVLADALKTAEFEETSARLMLDHELASEQPGPDGHAQWHEHLVQAMRYAEAHRLSEAYDSIGGALDSLDFIAISNLFATEREVRRVA